VLRATQQLLNGWTGFALSCLALLAALGNVEAASAEPSVAERSEQARQQADDLLRRARQALAADDLVAAEKLLVQAESLGVSYSVMSRGETPQAVRRDLELKKKTATVARPSQSAVPAGARPATPTNDPFMGRVTGSIVPLAASGTPMPTADGRSVPGLPAEDPRGKPLPFGRLPEATPGTNELARPGVLAPLGPYPQAGSGAPARPAAAGAAAGDAQKMLCASRKALAVGDVNRAKSLVQQAKTLNAQYDPLGDSPEKVEAAISKFEDIKKQQSNSEGWRRMYARMLLEQADALIRLGELDDAERLALQAEKQQLTYTPLEAKPQDLLSRISAARRAAPRAGESAPAGMAMAAAGTAIASAQGSLSAASDPARQPGDVQRRAQELARQAREALQAGQYARAETLAKQAELLGLPDAIYPANERPGLILLEVRHAKLREAGGVMAAAHQGSAAGENAASHALYDPAADTTRNIPASSQQTYSPPSNPRINQLAQAPGLPSPLAEAPREGRAMELLRAGEAAQKAGQVERAFDYYRQAAAYMNELDPITAQQLQDKLQLLSPKPQAPAGGPHSLADDAAAKQAILFRQVAAEIGAAEIRARRLFETDPKAAIAAIEELKTKVAETQLDSASREQLSRRVERALTEMKEAFAQNRPRIELDERNRAVREDIQREQMVRVEKQKKLAAMIDEFNRLIDEQRFAEAEVVANKCYELAPDEPVAQQVQTQAKMVRRFMNNRAIAADKENGFINALSRVDEASIPFDDKNPFSFGDVKQWRELTKSRAKLMAEHRRHRTERELEIEKKLRSPVSVQFTNAPLAKVIEHLGKLTDVNIHLDPRALAEQGVTTDMPISIDVRQDIMLKSVLNLILEPISLTYVVKDEVLMITSQQARDGQVYTVTYNVADLVTPIPNFVPNPDMGLGGAYKQAMANATMGNGIAPWGANNAPIAVVASRDGRPASGMVNPAVLAQMSNPAMAAAAGNSGMPQAGPGGMGGGPQADFDSLINLITSTVAPQSWDTVGGPGSIAPFETNLSIVVSQTQAVHEQIVDLLEQLRRLQDLQVTIEVRFLTLNDNFFERIGVDFDFNIDDNSNPAKGWVQQFNSVQASGSLPTVDNVNVDADSGKNLTVGMSNPVVFAADLDIPFRQNSFSLAAPQFGGFDPTAGAQIGFAILSDIEAYFFINAAQGDRRTNILQAPKVTLFNGQQAFISDSSTTPFVISVIPVVGDFAAAQQPVIVVLSEGTHMTVQAVVSNDRRFVRLTVVPFFSKIGEVNTFQFTGTETTTTDSSAEGWVNAGNPNDNRRNNNSNSTTRTRSGTAVQLPTFSYVTVTTTVSVPDGGTVLLGGIKRLREGRNEFGVPILNKVPFVNRLFKNVGIGRETQSLMMMVTPRIIIQEEEEQKLGIDTGT